MEATDAAEGGRRRSRRWPAVRLREGGGQRGLINHFSYIQSWPDISKFQTKPFPLYDKLSDLYDEHIAEGNFNFTSIEATEVSDDDPEVERDEIAFSFDLNQCEDDLHMCDDPRDATQIDGPRGATQSDGPKDDTQSDVTRAGAPGGSNKKPVEEPKKKKWDDPMVEVMAKYVDIKRKQAMEESALFLESKNAQQFTMSKCIVVLYKMESISHGERSVAYKVIKNVESREIFLNAAAKDEMKPSERMGVRRSSRYVDDTKEFMAFAERTKRRIGKEYYVLCPCKNCISTVSHPISDIEFHLYKRGFMGGYTRWTRHDEEPVMDEGNKLHGDEVPNPDQSHMGVGFNLRDETSSYRHFQGQEAHLAEYKELPTIDAASKKEFYPGCTKKYSKLSVTLALLSMKAESGLSNKAFI
ncbi:hypothetical protein D1007_14598 [Hordeum vulgare]|nr:hypothetical protein D1007_14598 [Hordeum vulgare]